MNFTKILYSIFLLSMLLINQAAAQSCNAGEVTLGGSSFSNDLQPLCPSPSCATITWSINPMVVEIDKERRFSHIELDFPGSPCMGGPMPFINFAPMGSMSATWNSSGSVDATVFVEVCLEQDGQCELNGNWSSPMEFCTFSSSNVPVLGTFSGEANMTRNVIIGATNQSFTINPQDLDFFNVPNLNSAFTWSLENVSSGGNIEINSTSGNATSVTANLFLDQCSDGDLVATATDKCGRIIEFKRFLIRRFCPTLAINGPSGCSAVWCEDSSDTFTYSVSSSGNTNATIGFSARFPKNMILISTSPGVTTTNSGGWTRLDSSEPFTFTVQPPFALNYHHPIVIGLEACEGTENSCDQSETVYIYSGKPNAIDLDMQVYGSNGWNKYRLCKYQFNYVEAFFNGPVDPCILEWEWIVPEGWQIYYPNAPDKTIVALIPNSNYGTVYVRARNKCGWSNWIGYGFSASSKCNFSQDHNSAQNSRAFKQSENESSTTPNEIIHKLSLEDNRSIFPNPKGANDQLQLQTELLQKNLPIRIFDSRGSIMYSGQLEAGNKDHELQLENLASGIYWVQLGSVDDTSNHKLIILD